MPNSQAKTLIRHSLLSMFASISISANAFSQTTSFAPSDLQGAGISRPTSLQFGPDDRLYVSQQDGTIKSFTISHFFLQGCFTAGEETFFETGEISWV